jgi:Na+/proline symporter
MVLPSLILSHTPLVAQIIFFGALLSAIMSCSSATLLAPSVSFSENIIRGFAPGMSDKTFLLVMRLVIVCFAGVVLMFALGSNASIFEMVESAYKVTLVAAFVPLAFGIFWKRASSQGALLAIVFGVVTWVVCEVLAPSDVWPAQIVGLGAALLGMVAGSLLPQRIAAHPVKPVHHDHHAGHHAAAHTHHASPTHHHKH